MRVPRVRRRVLIVAASALVVCIVVAWIVVVRNSPSSDLQALRKMGVPTNAKELRALAPTQGENAAPIYEAARQQWIRERAAGKDPDRLRTQLLAAVRRTASRADKRAGIEAMVLLQPYISTFVEASWKPRCVFATTGMAFDSDPTLAEQQDFVHHGCSMLQACAMLLSNEPDRAKSMQYLFAIERIATQMGINPDESAHITSGEADTLAIYGAEQVLRDHFGDRDVVSRVQKFVDDLPPQEDLRLGLKGEFVEELSFLNDLLNEPVNWSRHESIGNRVSETKPVIRHATGKIIKGWRRAFELMPKDSTNWYSIDMAFEQANSMTNADWTVRKVAGEDFLAFGCLVAQNWAQRLARRRLLRAALAIAQWQLDRGSLPSSLPLGGEDSIDPFGGKPLKYKKQGKGFIVYSIGRDMVDDGGKKHNSASNTWDLVMDFT